MAPVEKRIAILATGDEIINGDIVDSNSPWIAQQLISQQLIPGKRATVYDEQTQIEQTIHFLLNDHDVLITIGGLGPTSDDRTRFAIAHALDRKLIFDEDCWKKIINRLSAYGFNIPESNRQQCLFPEGAVIIPNENGTAAGCYLKHNNKHIFMLPGPPKEIQPIIIKNVLPQLIELNLQEQQFRKSWLLLGIGEGQLAEQIDQLTQQTDCTIGYRACSPYVELKLTSIDKKIFLDIQKKIQTIIQPYIISNERLTASEQLYQELKTNPVNLTIQDHATHGLLESIISDPDIIDYVTFNLTKTKNALNIEIKGLQEYWNKQKSKLTSIEIVFDKNKPVSIQKQIPKLNKRVLNYAVEIISWELLKYLKFQHKTNSANKC